MEDPGTLWLLHWLLLAPPSLLPVWWLAFNGLHAVEFDEDDLEGAVTTQLEAIAEWKAPHPSSVRKDVSALLRTYAPAERSGRNGIEDILDCPLRELNLIGRSIGTNRYRFAMGRSPPCRPRSSLTLHWTTLVVPQLEGIWSRSAALLMSRAVPARSSS